MTDSAVERLWTVVEAAEYLHVPVSAIYKMTARTARLRIPHIRLAGRLRFRRDDLDEWVELLTVSNTATLARMRKRARKGVDGHDP